MKIILTMAGKYERFKLFGNKVPKYLMPLGASTILWHVLCELKRSAPEAEFFLIANREDRDFFPVLASILQVFSIPTNNLEYISDTKSQLASALTAEKVFQPRLMDGNYPIVFANIDTIIRERSKFFGSLTMLASDQGLLDTFIGASHSYSYVKSDENDTAEIISDGARVSDKACSGLYGFGSASFFFARAGELITRKENANFTDLYTELLKDNKTVLVSHDDDSRNTVVLGTPEEYTTNIHRFR